MVTSGEVKSAKVNNNNGQITGELLDGTEYKSNGPLELSENERLALDENVVEDVQYETPTSSVWSNLIPLLLPVALLIGFFWWMQRRAQGQMGGIMSIGRSKAKT